jgi:hypothetical protein
VSWILIIAIHAGMMSNNDDIAITSIRMAQQNACQAAGQAIADKLRVTHQSVDFICIHDAEKSS